jgi:hypothetical protein
VAPGRRVCPSAQRVDAPAYVGCALGMNGPAGAIVAGCGVTASSGARRSVARSRRSPMAPPCPRSPTTTSGKPVCAAVGGPVRAAADTPSPLDCPRARLGCQAAFLPPVGSATRSNRYGALPHRVAPREPRHARACGLPPSLPRPALAPQTALWGWRAGSSRACQHLGASSSTADSTADPSRRRHTGVRSCLSVDICSRHCACSTGTLAPGGAGADR